MGKQFYLTWALVMLVDLLLILATDQLYGDTNGWIRRLIGAMIGGCHAALCMLPGYSFLQAGFWRLVLLAAGGCVAFDFHSKKTAAYCIMSLSLGSLAYGIDRGRAFDAVISVAALMALFFVFFRNKPHSPSYAKITIPTRSGPVTVTALHDTGNCLTDPVTGDPALIVSSKLCYRLLGIEASVLSDPIRAMQAVRGCRLIPYQAVGGKGLLIAKKFDHVTVNGKKQSVLIAISPNEIGNGKQFNALTGGLAA